MVGGLLDFLFPPRCGGCRATGTWLCDGCAASASAPIVTRCPTCGGWTTVHPCPLCRPRGWRPASIRGLLRLEGPIQEAVHRLKYRNRPGLAEPLVRQGLLLAAIGPAPPAPLDCLAIIPVPLHPRRRRERGYNQAALVAQALVAQAPDAGRPQLPFGPSDGSRGYAVWAGVAGGRGAPRACPVGGAFPLTGPQTASTVRAAFTSERPLLPNVRGALQALATDADLGHPQSPTPPASSPGRLRRVRHTAPQVGQPGTTRRTAMDGAFAWQGPAPPPPRVLLVDDVVTTGATLMSAALALHQAGTAEVHLLALAQG